MTRIGFSGPRGGMSVRQLRALFDLLASRPGPLELHHGDCVGADQEAHDIAAFLGARIVVHPPTNPVHRAFRWADEQRVDKPYLRRNEEIVAESGELVAAADPRAEAHRPRSGTWATVRDARALGRPVTFLMP